MTRLENWTRDQLGVPRLAMPRSHNIRVRASAPNSPFAEAACGYPRDGVFTGFFKSLVNVDLLLIGVILASSLE